MRGRYIWRGKVAIVVVVLLGMNILQVIQNSAIVVDILDSNHSPYH